MSYENNSAANTLAAFAVGALAGAAAIMFLDRDMRAKVVNKLVDARTMGEEQIEAAKHKAVEAKDALVSKTDEMLLDAHERLAENTASSTAKPAKKS